MPSAYEILELPEHATQEQIKLAYHRLAKLHHPDKGGNATKFNTILEAYQKLTNKGSEHSHSIFGIHTDTFNSMIHSINTHSTTAHENNYGELLHTNGLLTTYVKAIFEAQDAGIIDPAPIFRKLLSIYFTPKENLLTQLQYSLWSTLSNKHLAAVLTEEVLQQDKPLERVANLLNTTVISPEPRFLELLNAFFSIYPLYYHSMLSNDVLKRQMRLIPQDTMYLKTILQKEAKRTHALSHHINRDDMKLMLIINTIDFQIEQHIRHIETDKYPLNALEGLAKITKYADKKHRRELIFPYIFKKLTTEKLDSTFANTIHRMLIICISALDPSVVKNTILPVLIERYNKYDVEEHAEICSVLCAIAPLVEEAVILDRILPPILALSENTSGFYSQSRGYSCIHKMIHLISAESFQTRLLPSLMKGARSLYSDVLQHTHAAFRDIIALSQTESKSSHEKAIYKNAAGKLSATNTTYINDTLRGLSAEEINTKLNAFGKLGNLIDVAESKLLQEDIFPFIRRKLRNQNQMIRQAAYELCDSYIRLPDEKASSDNKKILLLEILNKTKKEKTIILEKAYSIIGKLAHLLENASLVDDVVTDILKICYFIHKRGDLLSDSGQLNSILMKTLSKVIKFADPIRIENELFPRLFGTLQFSTLEDADNSLLVFEAAMDRVSQNYLKEKVLPHLLHRLNLGNTDVSMLIQKIVRQLTYPERIYFTRLLLKNFEDSQYDRRGKVTILAEIYQLNQTELSQCTKPSQALEFQDHHDENEDYKEASLRA